MKGLVNPTAEHSQARLDNDVKKQRMNKSAPVTPGINNALKSISSEFTVYLFEEIIDTQKGFPETSVNPQIPQK